MERFDLAKGDIERLRTKFKEFQEKRNELLMLLIRYIADYCQFQGTPSSRQRFLRKKYADQTPRPNYPICGEDGFYWSVNNISIVLGRDRSSITRTLARMRRSEVWGSRVTELCRTIRSNSGLMIHVYHQDIFDLLLDNYEEEYLLRFANPRHGERSTAPDIQELRRFWEYLKSRESIQKMTFTTQDLSDIPYKGWRYTLRQIRQRASAFLAGIVAGMRRFVHRLR